MSTRARKARKRSGEKFVREPKVGTPLEERTLRQVVKETRFGQRLRPSNRHKRQIDAAIKIRDMDKETTP